MLLRAATLQHFPMSAATRLTKKSTVQIDARLVEFLRVLKPLVKKDMNQMLEPGGWDFVREHREMLEGALQRSIEIPEPSQEEMHLAQ